VLGLYISWDFKCSPSYYLLCSSRPQRRIATIHEDNVIGSKVITERSTIDATHCSLEELEVWKRKVAVIQALWREMQGRIELTGRPMRMM